MQFQHGVYCAALNSFLFVSKEIFMLCCSVEVISQHDIVNQIIP